MEEVGQAVRLGNARKSREIAKIYGKYAEFGINLGEMIEGQAKKMRKYAKTRLIS